MFKKLAVTAAILAVTSSMAIADTAPYIGASTGIIVNTLDTNIPVSTNAYRGVPFNLVAGYGGVISMPFYLAGEIQGTLTSASISDNDTSTGSFNIKSTYGISYSILPGVMLNEHSFAFARLGLIASHFTDDSATYRSGGLFGLGLETALTQNMEVRGEYDYAAYKSVSQSFPVLGQNYSVSPRSDQFTIGLIYRFE